MSICLSPGRRQEDTRTDHSPAQQSAMLSLLPMAGFTKEGILLLPRELFPLCGTSEGAHGFPCLFFRKSIPKASAVEALRAAVVNGIRRHLNTTVSLELSDFKHFGFIQIGVWQRQLKKSIIEKTYSL